MTKVALRMHKILKVTVVLTAFFYIFSDVMIDFLFYVFICILEMESAQNEGESRFTDMSCSVTPFTKVKIILKGVKT